ncbi:hypothetical protein [Rubellicoccus peritrichatus]|uniref:Uncharacterized protein n=1 Tax=Rubellicoccus peritrichatus TaxID=3080537 RepID=A0AAQ3LC93_9BACT|nr:hypothetical protein [Puniceicoccus sp. CR14]WOO43131.1 hypothetical protein RZN69_08500 [Puniceicoccus sp. CR14]
MEYWFISPYESLPTAEGHFLWPRYKHTGDGFFVCCIQLHMVGGHKKQPPESLILNQVKHLWNTCLKENAYAECDPDMLLPLDPHNPPDDEEIQEAVQMLMNSDRSYRMVISPPDDMSEEERKFYKNHGF